MWIYFIKDYFKKEASGEIVGHREGANINCPDEQKALQLIKDDYAIPSDEIPVKS